MNWKYITVFIFLLCLQPLDNLAHSESRAARSLAKMKASKDEMISMTRNVSFKQALVVFDDLAKRYRGKIIVDPTGTDGAIGVDINGMYWLDALDLVLDNFGLEIEEFSDHFIIQRLKVQTINEKARTSRELYETREVSISALFFEGNSNDLSQMGSSWNLTDGTDLSIDMTTSDNKTGLIEFSTLKELDFGTLTAIFKAMASKQLGDILANPQIVVQSGSEGRIQIGSDFSVTTQDFSGNTVTQFFSTGSIIMVTPDILTVVENEDTVTFIHLEVDVQRSNASSSELGIEVKKTAARTSVLLLDGEETMIGGLYVNEESHTREGVPFLKDLPWWCLGLRYVFGYASSNTIRKELIIVMRADLIPTLTERLKIKMEDRKNTDTVKESLEQFRKRFENYYEQKEHTKHD